MNKVLIPNNLFGRRLREVRLRTGIAQDKLGVAIGLDESSSSARMSRYETGIHEPSIATVKKIAEVLFVPVPYFFCDDDRLAEILIQYATFDDNKKDELLMLVKRMGENI